MRRLITAAALTDREETVRCPAPSEHRHDGGASAAPLRLPHPDWLQHRLTISGPAAKVTAFRAAAAGAGIIPWQLDVDALAEDWFLLQAAPPAPQQRTLSIAGARMLASQLREAVAARQAAACARVGRSRACPYNLHALLPVPDAILRLGPDHPEALAWLSAEPGHQRGAAPCRRGRRSFGGRCAPSAATAPALAVLLGLRLNQAALQPGQDFPWLPPGSSPASPPSKRSWWNRRRALHAIAHCSFPDNSIMKLPLQSISVTKFGGAFSLASTFCNVASWGPCDRSVTVSGSGHWVAFMRLRNSVSLSCSCLASRFPIQQIWNGKFGTVKVTGSSLRPDSGLGTIGDVLF